MVVRSMYEVNACVAYEAEFSFFGYHRLEQSGTTCSQAALKPRQQPWSFGVAQSSLLMRLSGPFMMPS